MIEVEFQILYFKWIEYLFSYSVSFAEFIMQLEWKYTKATQSSDPGPWGKINAKNLKTEWFFSSYLCNLSQATCYYTVEEILEIIKHVIVLINDIFSPKHFGISNGVSYNNDILSQWSKENGKLYQT